LLIKKYFVCLFINYLINCLLYYIIYIYLKKKKIDIYDYDYRSSASEDSGLLNDSDSFNQPLIRRSDEGSRIRRRKHVMYTFRNNKKLITTLITLLIVVLITLIFI